MSNRDVNFIYYEKEQDVVVVIDSKASGLSHTAFQYWVASNRYPVDRAYKRGSTLDRLPYASIIKVISTHVSGGLVEQDTAVRYAFDCSLSPKLLNIYRRYEGSYPDEKVFVGSEAHLTVPTDGFLKHCEIEVRL